jgi:hypothetical protein
MASGKCVLDGASVNQDIPDPFAEYDTILA